jgi:hypothetical protein
VSAEKRRVLLQPVWEGRQTLRQVYQRFPASDERPGKVAWPGLVFVN